MPSDPRTWTLGRPARAAAPTTWATPPAPAGPGAHVAVVGAGIAGCCVAEALTRRGGGRVSVIDARGHPADSLPPHLLGLLEPRLEKDASTAATLHALAAPAAAALYDRLATEGRNPWRGRRGAVSAERGRRDDAWRRVVVDRMGWPTDRLALLDRDAATARIGVPPAGDSVLWHPGGGALSPPALLAALLGETAVIPAVVASITPGEGGGWILRAPDGAVIVTADAVVLATACETVRLWPAAHLPLRPTRGQVSVLKAAGPEAPPRVAVSGAAYASPPVQHTDGSWWRILGATQRPWRPGDGDPYTPRPEDDARLRAALAEGWPALADALATEPTAEALAGLRATTPDHLPLAGPLFDADALAASHGDPLRKAARTLPPIAWPGGLFTLCGMGSYGLSTAPLMADLVAAQVTGTPWPLPDPLAEAIHPARFAVRALIRGRPVAP
ncbi:FAD-dependent 5-carboxymethylaminomethyl-2-thiouridine(34) oxidoreductase MnmC [Roseospira navarrensis]|uniref:FAD-dependent 5-carboxymethylaminomethyl-2-thiouridine(34) oxidoreductase MnmC n=1 Tax=Roseospira navarrensis TaxID=140058 RepID=A0A7X2D3W8_9PROT|nr:FAD-dependent 5-carboxymethylaminomethyl-2-thiouridine(34) oxidoreductase MnmC [Roseospira navarrensis]MQX35575.1 FAD-dependent 5-carboxymethylaminomethyl-2-thiouridine(34) oxidoreductase MnmC [Roseospira navarrensis]